MPVTELLHYVLIVLVAVVFVPLVHQFRISPVVGYVAVGAAVGPHGLGLIGDSASAMALADLGIVFLMFTIGLDLSIERLHAMRRHIFGLGTAQVAATGGAIAFAAWSLGLPAAPAVVLGATLAMSSTAVAMQVLSDQRDLLSRVGRISFAISLLQDMAVAPILVLMPLLGGAEGSLAAAVSVAVGKGLLAVAAIFLVGRLFTQPVFRIAAKGGKRETFVALVLMVALGTGWVTHSMGLSMAFGAFLAGLMIAGTIYRHQVAIDMEPFRGILLGLFFMTIGMLIDPDAALAHAGAIAVLVVGLIAVKAAITALLCRAFGISAPMSLRIGLLLAQGGEFAFVILSMALATGLLPPELAQPLIVAVAVTMALTPLLGAVGRHIHRHFDPPRPAHEDGLAEEAMDLHDHVIIAGFGRTGQTVASLLAQMHIPFLALDLDPGRIAAARARGSLVYYGNAEHFDILVQAGVERARAVVVTIDHPDAVQAMVTTLNHRLPKLTIVARAHDFAQETELERAGARFAVPELLESSLQLGGALLRSLGRHGGEVDRVVERLRARYHAAAETFVPAGGIAKNKSESELDSAAAKPLEQGTVDPGGEGCGILRRLGARAAQTRKSLDRRGGKIF